MTMKTFTLEIQQIKPMTLGMKLKLPQTYWMLLVHFKQCLQYLLQ
jgi:hypothetical protein